MTTKEYLSRAYEADKRIKSLHTRIETLQERAEQTTGLMNALRISGTNAHSKLENAVCEYIDLQSEIATQITTFRKLYEEISAVIDKVDNPTYRNLLEYRYLSFMTWEQLAVKMGYSYVHVVHRLHPAALANIRM